MLLSNVPCTILVFVQFLVIFTQTTLEVIVTPLTKLWYNFDAAYNSLLFTGMVGVVVVFLIIVSFLTKIFQDRAILMTGHLISGTGNVVFVILLVLSRKVKRNMIPLWQFCIIGGFYIAAIAFYQSTLGSLFSKLLNNKALDGRGQSLLSGASAMGSILGPLVSTSVLQLHILYVPCVMAGLWAIALALLIACWDFLYIPPAIVDINSETNLEGDYLLAPRVKVLVELDEKNDL